MEVQYSVGRERAAMPHSRMSNEEIDRRGQDLYERVIRGNVDTAANLGRQIVIDVETGDYEIDDDGVLASKRLIAKHPGAALYGLRIGYNAVYAIGGFLTPSAKG
jgi:hypothetical protein